MASKAGMLQEAARMLIQEAKEAKQTFLHLAWRNLDTLPAELWEGLEHLEILRLDGNNLLAIPPEIEQLKNLKGVVCCQQQID